MAACVQHAHEDRREADQEQVRHHHAQQAEHQQCLSILDKAKRERGGDAEEAQQDDGGPCDHKPGDDGVRGLPHRCFALGLLLGFEDGNERRGQRAFAEQPAK